MKIFEEQLLFPLFNILFSIFMVIVLFFAYLSYLQLQGIVPEFHQEPLWFNLFMTCLFIFFTWIVYQFKMLKVILTEQCLEVSFGVFKRTISRNEIERAYLDHLNSFLAYGGWGIRTGRYLGKRRWVYNLPGKKNIVIALKDSKYEFVFSVNNPERFILSLKS
jgi:hypothetical protein